MAHDEPATPNRETEIAAAAPQTLYLGTLAVSAVLLIVGGALEVVPWPVSLLGLASLGATKVPGGHWFALGGGLLFASMVLVFQISGVGETDYVERARAGESDAPAQVEAATGSLRLTVAQVAERWNALGHPPAMTRGLVRQTSSGPYDSFSYRFDSAASLAGAFDPSDDSVHALLVSVGLGHESAAYFYLHLCFMLHPYSQECIDGYLEEGLAGKELSEYRGVEHTASWDLGDQLWKLEIAGDVQSIRVLGPAVR